MTIKLDCQTCYGSGIVGSPPDNYMPCPECSGENLSDDRTDDRYPENIGDTCCGKCYGATCYVDYLTGERP